MKSANICDVASSKNPLGDFDILKREVYTLAL